MLKRQGLHRIRALSGIAPRPLQGGNLWTNTIQGFTLGYCHGSLWEHPLRLLPSPGYRKAQTGHEVE